MRRLKFQSTLPARGATARSRRAADLLQHFNPRSPHGERHVASASGLVLKVDFNPRSPHGERRATGMHPFSAMRISIHAPRTGSDGLRPCAVRPVRRFQSTLPARGATSVVGGSNCFQNDFNPRSPHGERHISSYITQVCIYISIHAPRTGSDLLGIGIGGSITGISIHAPRTGSDCDPSDKVHTL